MASSFDGTSALEKWSSHIRRSQLALQLVLVAKQAELANVGEFLGRLKSWSAGHRSALNTILCVLTRDNGSHIHRLCLVTRS